VPTPSESLTVSLLNGSHEIARLGGVFHCPLNVGSYETVEYDVGSGVSPGTKAKALLPCENSYGYNDLGISLFGLGGNWEVFQGVARAVALKESAVIAPSDMLAFGDCLSRSRNPQLDGLMISDTMHPFTGLPSATSLFPPKKQPTFLNHRGMANRTFVDGHVAVENLRKPFGRTDEQLQQWNYDDRPHRDRLQD
jgi:prepilin-type processing-associated H-X9-DG protein